jgi:hypothetical protein
MKNLQCIVNNHESLLNGAVFAFERGDVSNWLSYFRQDWARILFHDKFGELLRSLRRVIKNDKGLLDIIEKVFEIAYSTPDDHGVAVARANILGDQYDSIPEITKRTIESCVLEFLRDHKSKLPWYYVPSSLK